MGRRFRPFSKRLDGFRSAERKLACRGPRRAERLVVALKAAEPDVADEVVHYLNRLSDLLFVLCRVLARAGGHGEVLWQHERRRKPAAG